MKFSERHGFNKIETDLLINDIPDYLKMRIWNEFYDSVFKHSNRDFIRVCWHKFFKKDMYELDQLYSSDELAFNLLSGKSEVITRIKQSFFEIPWPEVYDFIEFFAEHYSGQKEKKKVLQSLNLVLEEEHVPYRVVDGLVIPLTSEEEIKELEIALNLEDRFKNARDHLRKAVALLSNREQPDYANSIKESISALESLVRKLLGKKGTLGDLLKKLDVHPAMKEGFQRLYGWTSDDGGIRHGKTDKALEPEFAEARYVLITTSAFVNYLIEKFAKEDK